MSLRDAMVLELLGILWAVYGCKIWAQWSQFVGQFSAHIQIKTDEEYPKQTVVERARVTEGNDAILFFWKLWFRTDVIHCAAIPRWAGAAHMVGRNAILAVRPLFWALRCFLHKNCKCGVFSFCRSLLKHSMFVSIVPPCVCELLLASYAHYLSACEACVLRTSQGWFQAACFCVMVQATLVRGNLGAIGTYKTP